MKKLIVLSGLSLLVSLTALYGFSTNCLTKCPSAAKVVAYAGDENTIVSHELKYIDGPGKVKKSPKRRDISYQSKEAFLRDFDHAFILDTRKSPYFDEIEFEQDHVIKTAFYNADSKLVATAEKKSFTDLPLKAQTYINKKYPGYAKGPVVFVDDNEFNESDMVMYAKSFEDADNYFIELVKGNSKIVLRSDVGGIVDIFKFL